MAARAFLPRLSAPHGGGIGRLFLLDRAQMIKAPHDIQSGSPTPSSAPAKPAPVKLKPGPGLPTTKAERAARMRVDKMVIKRMRKR